MIIGGDIVGKEKGEEEKEEIDKTRRFLI